MANFLVICLILLVSFSAAQIEVNPFFRLKNEEVFKRTKEVLKNKELEMTLGYSMKLGPIEMIANEVVTKAKLKEVNRGFFDPSTFVPSHHFFEKLDQIEYSSLYKLLQKMPKAGILHTHDTALGSNKILLDLTYKPHCWICFHEDDSVQFLFSKKKPKKTEKCKNWQFLEKLRENNEITDEDLMKKFTLYPRHNFTDVNDVWNHFDPIFGTIGGILNYRENYVEYLQRTFKELLDDGVQYVELRSSFRELYDLDGKEGTSEETIKIIQNTVNEFVKENPSFIGAKLIFSKNRRSGNVKVKQYIADAISYKSSFGDFMCGFDLVGQEDLGKPLQDYLPELLTTPNDINFFFHAGETNWYGMTTDENLLDAVMMRPTRIGHGYALTKHPMVVDLIKKFDIAIEVNPLSNQVLDLVKDLRNHPAAYFIANNIPMVVSSDDPSFWGAAPLSHDFYVTFLGIASARADLRLLKQLAVNSINYSCMTPGEKIMAFRKWKTSWNKWIKDVVDLKYS